VEAIRGEGGMHGVRSAPTKRTQRPERDTREAGCCCSEGASRRHVGPRGARERWCDGVGGGEGAGLGDGGGVCVEHA
jgi:hypothetical protein